MFGIYDDLTPDHVPGLQKYDKCMTEQVPGPQGVKIVGRHMPSAPKTKIKKFLILCCFFLDQEKEEKGGLVGRVGMNLCRSGENYYVDEL